MRPPSHTYLILLFWANTVTPVDTLLLATGATIYLYAGNIHQDRCGFRLIGEEWEKHKKDTKFLLPTPMIDKKYITTLNVL